MNYDFVRGAKVTGSKFYFANDEAAYTEMQLINYMIKTHRANGYKFIIPPYMVNKNTATQAGILPRFEGDFYETKEGMILIPTAETAMVGLHSDEIFNEDDLPIKYVAFSPCFRKESGAYGAKDKGLKRVHQFHKVELFIICKPEDSERLHNEMIVDVKRILDDIENACCENDGEYGIREGLCLKPLKKFKMRELELTKEDRAPWSNKTIDIEIAQEGTEDWLEVSSISNCGDNQSKVAQIRYKPKLGGKNIKCHLLNGSGVALPRLMVAMGLDS